MARKSDGEKIDELKELVAILDERLKTLARGLDAVDVAHSETSQKVAEVRRDYDKQLALLQREIDELKKWIEEQKKKQDEHSRRMWAFGPSLMGALLGGLITAAVAYFIGRR